MIRNYFFIAFRNLFKDKLFSIINISGMAIGLASCFMIALFVWDELQYDNYFEKSDQTFRIYNVRQGDDGITNYLPIVPNTFAPYLQKDFPEIESTLRMMDTYGEVLFEMSEKKIMEGGGVYAEPSIFDMLTIPVVSGNAATALTEPNSIALSKSLAIKYFGDDNPIGELITVSSKPRKVTAVYEDLPKHSHLHLKYILSFTTLSKTWDAQRSENWIWQQFFTYIRLKPGTRAETVEEKLPSFVEKYAYPKTKPEGFTYIPHLQNIKDIYLHSSNFEWEIAKRGNAQTIYVLSASALFILIIACLNFINLSTARSLKRMKEVGIRKVVGASKQQLIFQFISESVVVTLIGFALALVMVELTLPSLNDFAEKELSLPVSLQPVISIVGFCITLGVLAGSYPAFHLSRFHPALVLYNKNSSTGTTPLFRQGLVVLQFVFSFSLIIGSIVVVSQNNLLNNKDLGFSRDQLVSIELQSQQLKHYEVTKAEFLKNTSVLNATIGFGLPGDIVAGDGVTDPVTGKNWPANLFVVDHDYIKTLQMQIVAGRDFSRDIVADSTEHFIINETAAKTYGLGSNEEAVGKILQWNEWREGGAKRKGEIIGVVQDFHFKSLREQMTPVVMTIFPNAFWKITMRIKPENIAATIEQLKSTYEKLNTDQPFKYKFVDESFHAMYKSERKLSRLFTIFSGIAIIVACLGLFGLIEFGVNQRAKEISVRKVFGARISSLILILTRKYVFLILLAFVIVIPISYYISQQWLNNFAYHISISPWIYLKSCILILAISLSTIVFRVLKAAMTNPVENLRES